VLAGIGGRDDVFDQVLAVADPDDVALVRGLFLRRFACKDGLRSLRRLGARGMEETLGQGGAGAARVVEAVGLAGGTKLVPAEDADEGRELELAGVDERADLVVLLRPLGDFDPELPAQGDQAVPGEDL
jgi:hypothetical protein